MAEKGNVLGLATAVVGFLTAVVVLLTSFVDYNHTSAEANSQPKGSTPSTQTAPTSIPRASSVETPTNPPSPKKVVSELVVAGSTWEGKSGSVRMRLDVSQLNGQQFQGTLTWFGVSGNKIVVARVTGDVEDPTRVSFRWLEDDREFGSEFQATSYTGSVDLDQRILRGRWRYISSGEAGDFTLHKVR